MPKREPSPGESRQHRSIVDLRARVGERLAQLDELEIEIEKLVAGGEGFGRFDGIPIFVPRSAPGDRLRVRLVERHADYGRAEIVEVLHPGASRRRPPCPHFGRCGGCDLQHLEDAAQLDLKVAAIRETLERLGGLKAGFPVEVVGGEPFGYRLRAQLHTSEAETELLIGYHGRRSRDIVAVDSCPILVPELESELKELVTRRPAVLPSRLDLLVGDGGRLSTAPVTPNLPHGEIGLTVGDFVYLLDARCFFQAHRQLLPELVRTAVGAWQGEEAVELYAGVGLFTLPLAKRYKSVVAVEGDRVAARYARRNSQRYRLSGVSVQVTAVQSWVRQMGEGVDRVLVDPPRAGLPARVRKALLDSGPSRLTYVSCHAGTMARDLRELADLFRVEKLTFLDMFPQTGHMEIVGQLVADG